MRLAERFGRDDASGNARLDQLGGDGVRAPLRELHVVVGRARGVGMAADGDAAEVAALDVAMMLLRVDSALGLRLALSKSK